jgi:DNA gyrase/topoisomerase IV subunit A
MKEIPTLGRATQGVRIMRLNDSDTVASIGIVLPEAEQDDTTAAEPAKTE